MRLVRLLSFLTIGIVFASFLGSQPPARKKLLAIGEVKGFQHDSVSHALATIERMGQESGIYDTYIRTDSQLLTKQKIDAGNAKNLNYFDAVLFYTTGELDMTDQQKADLLSFVHDDGKGFIGAHSAIDTFYKWPEYGKMTGGYFDQHPWDTFDAPVIVEDPNFPGMKGFGPSFVIKDEIYQAKDWSRDDVRVLMRLDASKLDLKNPRVHRTGQRLRGDMGQELRQGPGVLLHAGAPQRIVGHARGADNVPGSDQVGDGDDAGRRYAETVTRPVWELADSMRLSWPQAAKISRPRGLRRKQGRARRTMA